MNKNTVFTGSGTAMITPFRDGKTDFDSLSRLIEMQISAGTDALIVCGTTGEAACLSEKERSELIEFTVKEAGGRIPVIAGTGCNETSKAVSRSKKAEKAGADGLLVVTPYYNKATPKGLVSHYKAVASATDLPVILYDVPSRTGVDIPMSVYRALTDAENVVGIKEASGSVGKAMDIISEFGDRFDIYSGNDDLILPIISVGGKGVISVVSNVIPKKCKELCSLALSGKTVKAGGLAYEMLPLIKALFSEVNPIPVKTALSLMGLCNEEFRLPLCVMEEENKKRLSSVLYEYGLINKETAL